MVGDQATDPIHGVQILRGQFDTGGSGVLLGLFGIACPGNGAGIGLGHDPGQGQLAPGGRLARRDGGQLAVSRMGPFEIRGLEEAVLKPVVRLLELMIPGELAG